MSLTSQDCSYNSMPCTRIEYKSSLEKLIKMGLYRLTADAIFLGSRDINYKGNTSNKILGLQNDDIKLLVQSNASIAGLNYFKELRKDGYRLNAEQLHIVSDWNIREYKDILRLGVKIGKVIKLLQSKSSDYVTTYRDYLYGCKQLH